MDSLVKIHWKDRNTQAVSSTSYLNPGMVPRILEHLANKNKVVIGYTLREQPCPEIPKEYIRNDKDPFRSPYGTF